MKKMKKLILLKACTVVISLYAMEPEKKERVMLDIHNVNQVVKTFAPLVYLSRDEKYKPSSFDWYLKCVALKNAQLEIIQTLGNVTPQDLADNPEATNFLDPNGNLQTYAGFDLQNNEVVAPIYINYKVAQNEQSAKLQTIFFYPFNGATPFLSNFDFLYDCFGQSVGDHEADLERVTFSLEFDKENEKWLIAKGFYSHHGSGILVDAQDMQFEDSHPIVYSAKYGHASYPKPFCINFSGDTIETGGARWEGWEYYEVLNRDNPSNMQKWIKFAGRLGVEKEQNPLSKGTKSAPTGLAARNWFKNVTD